MSWIDFYDLKDPRDNPDLSPESVKRRYMYRYRKMQALGLPEGSKWIERPPKYTDKLRTYARNYARNRSKTQLNNGILIHKNTKKSSSRGEGDITEVVGISNV